MSNELKHYGTPRHSGRYPWGSGGEPYQHNISFRRTVQELRKKGLTDVEIAKGQGMKTSTLRAKMSLARAEERAAETAHVQRMHDLGYSNMEIARRMNKNESSIRALLDPILAERAAITRATSKMLKEQVDKKKYIDIGVGVETQLGISRTKLNTAIAELQEQGYKIHRVRVSQVGMPNKFTHVKVLGAPDTEWKVLVRNMDQIQQITAKTDDYGRTYDTSVLGLKPIQSVSAKRIQVKYAEDGGSLKDGVIELRKGVRDLDLGGSKYAQVRIGVDGTHFLKGMAIYSDDMPPGVDIIFNTNKHNTGDKLAAMKKFGEDPDNPFGSTIKPNGQRGALNIVNEEGDWDKWSKTISSQVLSKQTPRLAQKQLDLAFKQKQDEYNEIMAMTNPVVKRELLLAFADDCDASSVHLKAAALPRQASKVILPVTKLKENEVYAPTFKDGETVVLIRHPHGGIFEIPQLTVNNGSKAAKSILAGARDAIGINPKVAQQLSGADFDGDTVIVIPNNTKSGIKTAASLKALQKFDPKTSYPGYPGMKKIDSHTKQTKMGEVSNLITDMTIKGASVDEIARAIKHSMVVIDSEKHNLNYKQSYIDNGIAALSARYQNGTRGGASTLISKASSTIRVPLRKEGKRMIDPKTGKMVTLYIDPKTGEKLYSPVEKNSFVDSKGKTVIRTTVSTKMAETRDAYSLSSGRPIEELYANYANNLKKLANQSRLKSLSIKPIQYSPSAKKTYEAEVNALNAKLNIALKNKPYERQAQILANSIIKRKLEAYPDMDADDLKKTKNAALAEARTRMGAKKAKIQIKDREWEAIQAGAITQTKLLQIIQNADLDQIKRLATPRTGNSLTTTQINRAKTLIRAGRTTSEVAEALGVSVSTLSKTLYTMKGENE